jgi:hypothetical protein
MKTLETNLTMTEAFWQAMLSELARRGRGTRESGAFLLGNTGSRQICRFICYDDLDPSALNSGIIVFDGAGYVGLWHFCSENKMTVLADIHTHPDEWTGQSRSDQTNPMVGQIGHIALIAPFYAQFQPASLDGVGIYEYLGNHNWKTWEPKSKKVQIT